MKRLFIPLLSLLFLGSCNIEPSRSSQYEILGKLEGAEDSIKLMLSIDNETVDSTFIVSGAFKFEGEIEEPTSAFILTDPPFTFTSLWLDPGTIVITGDIDDFRNVKVVGGRTQQEAAALKAQIARIEFMTDSMTSVAMKSRSGQIQMTDEEKAQFRKDYQALKKAPEQTYFSFIKDHPDSYFSLDLLSIYATTWGKEKSRELLEQLSLSLKAHTKAEEVRRFVELSANVDVDQPFVDFESETPDGEKLKLSEVKGKYILIDFWASWCAPCRADHPKLINIYNEFKENGFEIFAVSLDKEKDSWEKAILQDQIPWIQVSDLQGEKGDAPLIYNVSGIPDNFLIDSNGIIIARNLRGRALRDTLEAVFEISK